jgi:hypothetical protein
MVTGEAALRAPMVLDEVWPRAVSEDASLAEAGYALDCPIGRFGGLHIRRRAQDHSLPKRGPSNQPSRLPLRAVRKRYTLSSGHAAWPRGPYSSLANGVYTAATLSKRRREWGEFWAERGYIALLVDSFGPRGYPAGFPKGSYEDRPSAVANTQCGLWRVRQDRLDSGAAAPTAEHPPPRRLPASFHRHNCRRRSTGAYSGVRSHRPENDWSLDSLFTHA